MRVGGELIGLGNDVSIAGEALAGKELRQLRVAGARRIIRQTGLIPGGVAN